MVVRVKSIKGTLLMVVLKIKVWVEPQEAKVLELREQQLTRLVKVLLKLAQVRKVLRLRTDHPQDNQSPLIQELRSREWTLAPVSHLLTSRMRIISFNASQLPVGLSQLTCSRIFKKLRTTSLLQPTLLTTSRSKKIPERWILQRTSLKPNQLLNFSKKWCLGLQYPQMTSKRYKSIRPCKRSLRTKSKRGKVNKTLIWVTVIEEMSHLTTKITAEMGQEHPQDQCLKITRNEWSNDLIY